MKFVDLIIFSQTTRIAILLTICLAIGFIAPAIINVFLEFAPPNPFVAGTCHINVGMRANCFPEVDAKNQLTVAHCAPGDMKCLKTECENRGCCYQDLDLEEGAPICHRKIPSLHDVNLEVKSIMEQSSSPSITFELNMKKHSQGTLTIDYFIDGSDQCSDEKVPEFNNKTFNSVSITALDTKDHPK